MTTYSSSHVMRRTGLAPLVHKFAARQRELRAHIGIAKHEDRSFLVDTLCHHELEHTVLVLRDSQISYVARGRIELSEIAATGLAVEHGHNLHRRLVSLRDIEIART